MVLSTEGVTWARERALNLDWFPLPVIELRQWLRGRHGFHFIDFSRHTAVLTLLRL